MEVTENKRLWSPRSTQDFSPRFSAFVESWIEQDEDLIIRMDANDTDQANSDFRKFHSQCNLVDVFAHLHPDITPSSHISTQ
eukprot:7600001-Ditylum_brightwellii.AAC.1